MRKKSTPSVLLIFILANIALGCYVSKPLATEVKVSINSNFPVIIKNEGNSHFVDKYTESDYRSAYLKELTKEFTTSHIKIDNASPEFIIQISSLDLTESTKPDTIKDPKSKDFGLVRELTQAGLKTYGTVVRIADQSTHKWEADKDKNETVTNNQSLQQMIDGENKDNSVYREKAFSDDEFVTQSGVCGKRAAVRITHEIGKLMKK